VGVFQSTVEEK
jgi:hypothetical protein